MRDTTVVAAALPPTRFRRILRRAWDILAMPLLAIFTAFLAGGIVIWITSGQLSTVFEAYGGLIRGALLKERGFSETLVAMKPYVFLSLGLAVGFKSGLFNIGVEGQFYIGAVSAAFVGQLTQGLPAIIHLPLAVAAGAAGGALWAAIPGYLKAKTGAHEVINTIMMNYIAFRLVEYLVSGPLRDTFASGVQTFRVSPAAELWSVFAVSARLADPLNALGVALVAAFLTWSALKWWVSDSWLRSHGVDGKLPAFVRGHVPLVGAILVGLLIFILAPLLTRIVWPFQDEYDRLHIGFLFSIIAAVAVWRLLWHTKMGFELRAVGANPNAARYAGAAITRDIVLAMAISGGLAGIAGTIEVLGVSICRCLPLFFSSGYGFDAIAITLLAKSNPFGILAASLLFGAIRNGADLMELTSGVSKYIVALIQALVLLFVAAPAIVRWIYRIKSVRRPEEEAPLTRGWGG
jgi:general nucleoside transport system permease protein